MNDKFNDIEPIIESHFSYYIYSIAALLAVLLFIAGVAVYKKFKKKNRAKSPFESLDFNNPNRELLYKFTQIAKENPKEGLDELLKEMEAYKYAKDAKEVDEVIVRKMKQYVREA